MEGRRRLTPRIAALAVAALVVAGTSATARAASLKVSPYRHGVVVRVVGKTPDKVIFAVDGRAVARVHRAPYQLRLPGARLLSHQALRRMTVVARDLQTGRRLGIAYVARPLSATKRRQPTVTITSSPTSSTLATSASFGFTTAYATKVQCTLDGTSYSVCSSPKSYNGLAVGSHTFSVRASNSAGSATATASWTIAALTPPPPPAPSPPPPSGTAPTVTLTGTPSDPTQATDATFTFVATGATTLECKLDAASYSVCASPKSYSNLAAAGHAFSVRATNSVGSATASATWTISQAGVPAPPAPTAPGVVPPAPPSPYSVPSGAVRVTSSAGLISALTSPTPTDIVLADGVYDSTGPFLNPNGDRIYAQNLGRAVFHAGLVFGGNWGPGNGLVRGVAFDVSDPSKTLQSDIVHVWGSGKGTHVLDSTFDGHNALSAAISARQDDGLVVQRVQVRNFVDYGVFADQNDPAATLSTPVLLEDVDVSGVSHAVPRSSNGTAEACIWLGNNGTLRRARVRLCAWMGVWTGTANKSSLHEDLDIDGTPVGVYAEHFTTSSTFQHMRIGAGVATGVICEWADPSWGSRPGCTGDVIQDSYFASSKVGVYLDQGTTTTTVRRCTFVNQTWAAIGDYLGAGNVYDGQANDYSGIAAGAATVSHNHLA